VFSAIFGLPVPMPIADWQESRPVSAPLAASPGGSIRPATRHGCHPYILYQPKGKRCLLPANQMPLVGPWYRGMFHFWKTFGKTPYNGMVPDSIVLS
jgi:hypothetical protein